jgi:hypothetical protein
MRQEKTLKLIVNCLIDPRIRMTKMDSNDKTWVWTCYDFSEAEIVEEVFAFKCTSIEDATTFKEVRPHSRHARLRVPPRSLLLTPSLCPLLLYPSLDVRQSAGGYGQSGGGR